MKGLSNSSGLARTLGIVPLVAIVIANMIGTGIFTTTGLVADLLTNPFAMSGIWLLAGLVALSGAMCYGELGANMPEAGGEYVFLSKIYHPALGFMSGWTSFIVGFSAPIAAASIAVVEYLHHGMPDLLSSFSQWSHLSIVITKRLAAAVLILLLSLAHTQGLHTSVKLQNVLTLFKLCLLVFLIVMGFTMGQGTWTHFHHQTTIDTPSPNVLGNLGIALMWVMFAYSGWNASTYIGAEIKNPQKVLPRSLIIGTLTVILLYVVINILFVYTVDVRDMRGVVSVGLLAIEKLFGSQWLPFASIVISIALLSSVSAFIILGPRVYYAMAIKGHFFRIAAYLHPRHRVPIYSVLIQAIVAMIIVFSGTFDQILSYLGYGLTIFPLLTVIGLLVFRLKNKQAIRLPGIPVFLTIFTLSGMLVLWLGIIHRPMESFLAIGVILAGLPLYFLFRSQKSGS